MHAGKLAIAHRFQVIVGQLAEQKVRVSGETDRLTGFGWVGWGRQRSDAPTRRAQHGDELRIKKF